MEFSIANVDIEKSKRKSSYQLDLRITDRDILIFKFLLEMKFASREAIAEKFFWSKDQKSEEKTIFRTRDRLYKLQIHNWITPVHCSGSSKNYFQATWKAYYEVLKRFPSEKVPRPQGKPELDTFDHDLMVLNSRTHLERHFQIKGWISDKTIRMLKGNLQDSSDDFSIPDGIYLSQKGVKTAFEYERIQKSKSQYREKLKSLARTLRSGRDRVLNFQKAHFVCLTHAGFKFLKEETKIYGDLFLIEKDADFFNSKLVLENN